METLGRCLARHPRRVLLIALLGFLALSVYGIATFGKLSSGGQVDPKAPSSQAEQLLSDHFGGQQGLVVLVTARHGTVDAADVQAVGRHVTATLRSEPWADNVTSYFVTPAVGLRSTDQRAALVMAHVQDEDRHKKDVSSLIKTLSAEGGSAALVQSGGETGTTSQLTTQIGKDLAIVSIVAVPITVVLLYFVFGGLLAALLPLAVSVIAIMGTFAELRLLTTFTPVSSYAIDLTIALGLGLAVDYGLLIVNRYREEIATGNDTEDAIARTATTAGRTVLFSAITVALALTALLVFPVYFLQSFAYAGIAVVFFAAVGALVVLPALLAVLGARTATRRRRRVARTTVAPAAAQSRMGRAIATAVTRRPVLFAAPVVLVLVLIGLPLLNVHFSTPDERALPATAAAHQVGDALRTRFAGTAADALTAVAVPAAGQHPTSGPAAAQEAAWRQYSVQLSRIPGVRAVQGPAGTYRDGAPVATAGRGTPYRDGYAYWTISNSIDPISSQAATLLHAVRATPAPAGASVLVGGRAADLADQKHSIGSQLPWAIAIMILASFVMLFLFTGSVLIPVKAIVLNALTLFAVMGAMIWVFQGGHLAGLLGFTPTATSTTIPPLLFVIAFGLSMDYEVFVISRIKEQHDQGLPNREAIVSGIAKAGTIVTTAAALLSVTFFAFGLSKISFLQFFGLGTGIAILLDAFIVRGILLPAVMQLVGERIWWAPRPLRRLHARIGLRENDPQDHPAIPVPS